MGQKPLYYSFLDKGLIISSEIKDIIFLFKKLKVPILENQKIVEKYLIGDGLTIVIVVFLKIFFRSKLEPL